MRKRNLVMLLIALVLVGCGKTDIKQEDIQKVEQTAQTFDDYVSERLRGDWYSSEINETFSFSNGIDKLKVYEEGKLVYDLENIQMEHLKSSDIKNKYNFSDTITFDTLGGYEFISISATVNDSYYYREFVIKDDIDTGKSFLGIINYNSETHQDEIIMMRKKYKIDSVCY